MRPIGKRVLFVDDEPSIRATLPVILRRYGFVVTVAGTVQQALEAIEKDTFDLLLSDLNIERDGDAYQVVRAIRAVNPRCVIIVITGYPGFESAVDGIHHGIDDYIVKPTQPDALVALLAEKLAARHKARILSVSYDSVLLQTRHLLLEMQDYDVVSAHDLNSALQHCKAGGFDVFILGHSIAHAEKEQMVKSFRESCHSTIISLRRNAGEQPVSGVDYDIQPDPEPLLKLIGKIVGHRPARWKTQNAT